MQKTKYPLALIILDGFGIKEEKEGNAVALARKPNFDFFCDHFPKATLAHSGLAVGLPAGIVGNSEVGHKSIGSGRITLQTMFAIKNSLLYGGFFENQAFLNSIKNAREKSSKIHIIGLLSDAGGHSHIDHLFGILRILLEHGFNENVFIHAFTDGRDVPPKSAEVYIKQTYEVIQDSGMKAHIASIGGRYYGMDRAENWDRIEKAYNSMIGASQNTVREKDIYNYIQSSYEKGVTDEFIEPATILNDEDKPIGPIEDGDSLIFFNFRPDRMKEILKCFFDNDFNHFQRRKIIENNQTTYIKDLHLASLTEYETDTKEKSVSVAFREEKLDNTLTEILSKNGLSQAHITETEKQAHITYFLNGGHEERFPEEDHIIIPSLKVKTYDLEPTMRNKEIADTLIDNLTKKNYDFYAVNFASSDMVGHTGSLKAAIEAIESIDKELGRIYQEIEKQGGFMIITSDHGNIEEMVNPETGEMDTEHNINPAPFLLVSPHLKRESASPIKIETMAKNPTGTLADVMPTILELYGIPMPEITMRAESRGTSLLERLK